MTYHYAFQGYDAKTMARGVGTLLRGVSRKDAFEIARSLRGRPVKDVIRFLESVANLSAAVPYRRFNHGIGHRKGHVGPGRYPVKAASRYLKLVKSVRANAVQKNLDNERLVICHICVQKGPNQPRQGRHSGRQVKQCHIELAVCEAKEASLGDQRKRTSPKKVAEAKAVPAGQKGQKDKMVQDAQATEVAS